MNFRNLVTCSTNLLTGLVTSHRRPCNVAAFHLGRCGSRLLGDLLHQHPCFVWEGELFSPGRLGDIAQRWPLLTRDPLTILRLRMTMAGHCCYGFETQPTQVEHLDMTVPRYVERLEALGFDHFVVLERKNHLRRIVSMLVARTTSQWHVAPEEKHSLVRVELDVDHLLLARGRDTERRSLVAHLQREQESARSLKDVLADRRLLYLTYEDDIAVRPAIAYQRVCEFTGIKDHPVTVRFRKTNPHTLTDVLTNFSQVEQSLRGTPFEWMLYS